MSETNTKFRVALWEDEVIVGYAPNHGRLSDDQPRPHCSLYGRTNDGARIKCVCVSDEGVGSSRAQGSICVNEADVDAYFEILLPLPKSRFDWLQDTLARRQERLSEIEVELNYVRGALRDGEWRNMGIRSVTFTLTTGDCLANDS